VDTVDEETQEQKDISYYESILKQYENDMRDIQ
jgi:hypothetical protein